MVTTQIHATVDINGGLTLVQNVSEFPSSPRVGQFIQKDGIIYTYGDTGTGVVSWLPISIRRTTYVHQQDIPSDNWIVTHNLNTVDYGIIVYDENHNSVSSAPSVPIDKDSVRVSLNTPISGTAILIAVTDFSATSITLASLILGGSSVTAKNGKLLVNSVAVASEAQISEHIAATKPHSQYLLKTESAATANKLASPITINGVSFDGSSNITIAAVESVAGKTGVVILSKSDVGLHQVDDTADLDKPISLAVQEALNSKQPAGQYIIEGDARISDSRPASDVNAWAKSTENPAYTAAEVGAANDHTHTVAN